VGAVIPARRSEAGLTLTEVTVVMIIGTMIMAGLVGFYLASQGLWLDASTQAITQREASLVASAIRDRVRSSGYAQAFSVPDSLHQQLALFNKQGDTVPSYYFWWDPSDSLIHAGPTIGGANSGPMVSSLAERFQVTTSNLKPAVRVDLRLRSATGSTVEVGTLAVFMN
jgi:Tfp pilus assembly protein PilW